MKCPFFFHYKFQFFFWSILTAVVWLLFSFVDIDPVLTSLFYLGDKAWVGEVEWVEFLYQYGTIPANFLGVLSIIALLRLPFRRRKKVVLSIFLGYLLCWIIGPGLIVNVLLKSEFQRPRPYETVMFGGDKEYSSPMEIGGGGESLASGHASAGFVLTFFFFVFYRLGKPATAYTIYFSAWLLGLLLSYARISTGNHFLSDILIALCITQLVNAICVIPLFLPRKRFGNYVYDPPGQLFGTIINIVSVILLTIPFLFFVYKPTKHTERIKYDLPPEVRTLVIDLQHAEENVFYERINERFTGYDYLFGGNSFPWNTYDVEHQFRIDEADGTAYLTYKVERGLLDPSYNGRISFYIPMYIEVKTINPKELEIKDW